MRGFEHKVPFLAATVLRRLNEGGRRDSDTGSHLHIALNHLRRGLDRASKRLAEVQFLDGLQRSEEHTERRQLDLSTSVASSHDSDLHRITQQLIALTDLAENPRLSEIEQNDIFHNVS